MGGSGKCPVMHGSLTNSSNTYVSNKYWWPNQLNLNILHQNDVKSDPMDKGFNCFSSKELKNLYSIYSHPFRVKKNRFNYFCGNNFPI